MFNVNQKGLMEQDLSNLDVITLHPLSPEVISRQATINIGTTSHLAHGKSTAVKAISGVQGKIFGETLWATQHFAHLTADRTASEI
ncbi:uncharacterized protein LOC108193900 isoform X3 [Daucus carota subsp. sativus]